MTKMISQCPVCNNKLKVSTLQCSECGLEIKKDFELSAFDTLPPDMYQFLIEFLKSQGNLKDVQLKLSLSYPAAKKKMMQLLIALDLYSEDTMHETEECNMNVDNVITKTHYASKCVREKLIQNGGNAVVHTIKGKEYKIWIIDNEKFGCDVLPPYFFSIFDVVVDLLISQGGKAKKGTGRARLGDAKCELNTVAGAILKNYYKKSEGESAFAPDFAIIAILEWAEIIKSEWGYVELTAISRGECGL